MTFYIAIKEYILYVCIEYSGLNMDFLCNLLETLNSLGWSYHMIIWHATASEVSGVVNIKCYDSVTSVCVKY